MDRIFKDKVLKIKESDNYRELNIIEGIDFSSNDYLGLSNHPKIKQALIKAISTNVPIGSGGSRLLSGNCKEHCELEEFAADYFNSESAMFFNSGFLANYAIFTTLPDRSDFIIYDELIHASVRDGINASTAKSIKFKHNDLNSMQNAIEKAQSLKAKSIWISIESIYSMDGDIADILVIMEIIKKYDNVYLVIDEAHATGIFGKNGKGFSFNIDSKKIISLHTCGKALGVSGAIICAVEEIIDYMINKSRPFIYTTAESPLIAVAVKEALILSQEESWRREKLLSLVEYTAQSYLNPDYKTQILPIIMNDSQQALIVSEYLQKNGFNIKAIRPPTVPSARLRLSLNVNRTQDEIDKLFSKIASIMEI